MSKKTLKMPLSFMLMMIMTLLFSVPVFAGTSTFKDVKIPGLGTCDVTVDVPDSIPVVWDTSSGAYVVRGEFNDGTASSVDVEYSVSKKSGRISLGINFAFNGTLDIPESELATFSSVGTSDHTFWLEQHSSGITCTVTNIKTDKYSGIKSELKGSLNSFQVKATYSEDTSTDPHTFSYTQGNSKGFISLWSDAKEKKDDDDDDDHHDEPGEPSKPQERQLPVNMSPEEAKGWETVGKEPATVVPGATTSGLSVKNAYQGTICQMVFKLGAPGFSIGRTYDISSADGAVTKLSPSRVSLKIPMELQKAGRTFMMVVVTNGQPVPLVDKDTSSDTITVDTNQFGAAALMYRD